MGELDESRLCKEVMDGCDVVSRRLDLYSKKGFCKASLSLNTTPHVMCSQCIDIPAGYLQAVQCADIFFLHLSCHSWRNAKAPAPYFGFYHSNMPAQGGQPVLPHFLQLNGKFETTTCMLLASAPIALIYFVIGAHDKVVMPVPLLDQYLQHFYPDAQPRAPGKPKPGLNELS
ncbi:hypothetical protein F4604DRAFT_1687899 [Suillus subluteus]|nr:hypothetical protein F4604DRAFT_1687899 [Suillus subluteus]